jgi:LysM repeat protein
MPTTTTTRTPTPTSTVARYYTIQSGDTLAAVAAKQNTTVADLLRLNPGVDPTALHVGQRIRVG